MKIGLVHEVHESRITNQELVIIIHFQKREYSAYEEYEEESDELYE